MIEFDACSIRVGDFTLGPLSTHIACGDYVMVTGPSGAGKSVLLETVAGFHPIGDGRFLFRGRESCKQDLPHRRCGWLPQSSTLFPHLSVADNIAYPMRVRGEASLAERSVSHWADVLGITPLLARMPGSLSGGEAKRVALARVLVAECDVWLLDEPFGGLDGDRAEELSTLVWQLASELGTTVLHVSHDIHPTLNKVREIHLVNGQINRGTAVAQSS